MPLALYVAAGTLVLALSAAGQAPTQIPPQDRSTATQNPTAIDAAWQRASAKYDRQRSAILAAVDKEAVAGPFRPDWHSLSPIRDTRMVPRRQIRHLHPLGCLLGSGIRQRVVSARDVSSGLRGIQTHVATYGPHSNFGYKDFIPMFKAEHFDPEAWADLFKEAGARYVVPVVEHHDGFAMYDSELSDWNAAKMGPHRDVVGELAAAVRAHGLHLGASSHRIEQLVSRWRPHA